MTLARLAEHYVTIKVGNVVFIDINQGTRIARVLAIADGIRSPKKGVHSRYDRPSDPKALIEYTNPTGTTALAFCHIKAWKSPETDAVYVTRFNMRPCTYRGLLRRWLVAVIKQSGSWQGNSFTGKVPSPRVVLHARLRENKNGNPFVKIRKLLQEIA